MYVNGNDIKCNKCKKTVPAKTRGEASKKASKAGWQLKSAKEHYCPDHRSITAKPVAKKLGKAGKSKPKTLKSTKKVGNVISFTSSLPGNDNPN